MRNNKKNESPFLLYKGKPLVKCGNVLYYGRLSDKYVIKMEVDDPKMNDDLKIHSKVTVEMMDTSTDISNTKKILKVSEKTGLYDAIDIAQIWLTRAESSVK